MDVQAPAFEPVINLNRNRETVQRTGYYEPLVTEN